MRKLVCSSGIKNKIKNEQQVALEFLKFSEMTLPLRSTTPLRCNLWKAAYWKISKLYINVGSAFEKQSPLKEGNSAAI